MQLSKVYIPPDKKSIAKSINAKAEESDVFTEEQRKELPKSVFIISYKIHDRYYEFDLNPLLEIDVHELNELTLNNLRVQMERISSIRTTFGKAYEQMMEDYGHWLVKYDIWLAGAYEQARVQYWTDQEVNRTKWDLAKSSMKPPTQDDLKLAMLLIVGRQAEYEIHMEKKVKFQRQKSEFERIDDILKTRGFELKTIIDSRVARNG